jgi:ABC-type glycerol-3-phosphate transport system substrate-binding protein
MTSSSQHPDEAWTFLKFFGSEDGAKVWLDSTYFHVVPNKSIMQSQEYLEKVPGFDATVCLEMMDLDMFVARPEPLEVFRFRDISGEELDAIRLAEKTVPEALDSFQARMQPILDESA